MSRSVYLRSDIGNILAALYKPGDDAWNEVLIRVGLAVGLKPSEWVPTEEEER